MSFPNIPDVTPVIDIDREDVINLLLVSIAFEELGLAHMINAEAEKIQFVLGTLDNNNDNNNNDTAPPTLDELLQINRSVERTLRSIIKKEILLQFKLEDILLIPDNNDNNNDNNDDNDNNDNNNDNNNG